MGSDIEGHSQSPLKREETVRTQRTEGREGEKRGAGRQTEEEVKRIRSCLDGNSQNFEMKREQFRDGAAETGEKGQKQN